MEISRSLVNHTRRLYVWLSVDRTPDVCSHETVGYNKRVFDKKQRLKMRFDPGINRGIATIGLTVVGVDHHNIVAEVHELKNRTATGQLVVEKRRVYRR